MRRHSGGDPCRGARCRGIHVLWRAEGKRWTVPAREAAVEEAPVLSTTTADAALHPLSRRPHLRPLRPAPAAAAPPLPPLRLFLPSPKPLLARYHRSTAASLPCSSQSHSRTATSPAEPPRPCSACLRMRVAVAPPVRQRKKRFRISVLTRIVDLTFLCHLHVVPTYLFLFFC
uniref:Uncharacterized protein n=1 Tax=Oryza sativa subsp. japonica TaxID=39947 RepID=Q6EUE8_ORYSJ|nr:hypothetical protein [Oryza sativa Japonica Group]